MPSLDFCHLTLLVRALAIASTWLVAPHALAQMSICQTTRLLTPSPTSSMYLGWATAIHGDCAVISAVGYPNGQAFGQVYVFRLLAGSWTFEATLTPSDPSSAKYFGYSVAVHGDRIVVGAANDNGGTGAAYIFDRESGSWVQKQKIFASNAASGAQFGLAVAVSEWGVVVGANYADGAAVDSGAAYMFEHNGTSWVEVARLDADNGAVGDEYGYSVAMSGDAAVIGAPEVGASHGSAYVFRRTAPATWTLEQRLDGASARLGFAVDIDDDLILCGAPALQSAIMFRREAGTWLQKQQLNPIGNGLLAGCFVAVDGDWALVSAHGENYLFNDDGAAYLYKFNGASWAFNRKLTATPGVANAWFGWALAMDQGVAVIGASRHNEVASSQRGAAFVFSNLGDDCNANGFADVCDIAWELEQDCNANGIPDSCDITNGGEYDRDANGFLDSCNCSVVQGPMLASPRLRASDGYPGNIFNEVAASSQWLIVGAEADGPFSNPPSGCAYIYSRQGYSLVNEWKLAPPDGVAGDSFGGSVAVDGDLAVVGASDADPLGSSSGAAYVYRFISGAWTFEQKLTAIDGAASEYFGFDVDVLGDRIAVSARLQNSTNQNAGAVYIYRSQGGVWVFEQKLVPPTAQLAQSFGLSLAMSGDRIIVGSPYTNSPTIVETGAAFVFQRQGTAWTLEDSLFASDGAIQDLFGFDVAIENDIAIIGAMYDDDLGADSGAAYVFKRVGADWQQQQKLHAADGAANEQFGNAVALDGNVALIGAYLAELGPQSSTNEGAAYLFEFDGATWTQEQALRAYLPAFNDSFGQSIALIDDHAYIGAAYFSPPTARQGAVFPFSIAPDCNANGTPDVCDIQSGASQDADSDGIPDECESPPCPADTNGDGNVNVTDLLAVVGSWGACVDPNNCPADVAPPGGDDVVNVTDLLAVIGAWGACP